MTDTCKDDCPACGAHLPDEDLLLHLELWHRTYVISIPTEFEGSDEISIPSEFEG